MLTWIALIGVALAGPKEDLSLASSKTASEADRIVEVLRQQAERGTQLVVVADDAYFGLFYHLVEPPPLSRCLLD